MSTQTHEELARRPIVMFDLGGVLYHINLQRTRDSFSLLAGKDVDFSLTSQHEVFDRFECGKSTPDEFREHLRSTYSIDADDEQMDAAWNALLVGLDPRSVSWLRAINRTHRVVLLSNINSLHHARIADECAELFAEFERLYLSYEIGLRKPWVDIYEHVLRDLDVPESDIYYLDDSPQHIAAARSLGIYSQQVPNINDVPMLLAIN